MTAATLDGWTPFRAAWHQGRMIVDWCHLDDKRFVEPFFYETIVQVISQSFNLVFQQRTSIEVLREVPSGLRPSGFIFHMSRCGSTLCAQALAAMSANVVISEAIPIRAVLRAPLFGPASSEEVAIWLAGMVNALSRPRFPEERRFFAKFMASDVLDLPLITRVFPDVPWIFLYRDPTEILASQQAMRSAELMPGQLPADRLGLTADAIAAMSEEVYWAHCLAAFGQAALGAHRPGQSLIMRYDDLPALLWEVLPAHFGFALAEADHTAMLRACGRHAKDPGTAFVDDRAAKQAAGAAWRDMAERIVGPTYAALDRARLDVDRSR